jgi:hypothetical protein
MMVSTAPTAVDLARPDLKRTARATGLLYLGVAITGLAGFIIIRGQIMFVAGNPAETLSHVIDHDGLARVGIAVELALVLTQALTALWFFRLFRSVEAFAAGLIAVFGMVNAVAILASAAILATARDVAGDASLAGTGDVASTVQLLYVVSGHLWGVASLFFGLWLIPMGWLVVRSRWLPKPLGWVLIVGGCGYVLSTFVTYLLPDAGLVTDLLTVPASIGEFWILGYLIVIGVRPEALAAELG